MMSFEKWLSEFRDVNPSGEAPHKPLLLLTVLKAAERDGDLPDVLLLSPELVYQFKLFEHIVAHRRKQKLDIRMPFHHLKSSGVWAPLDKHGESSTHRSVTTCVKLDPDFRAACLDAEFRQRAATILIDTYFRPEEQIALREMMGLPADVVIPESESDETPEQEARSEGRSASFRLDVVPAYNYTCALTGYRHLLYRLLSDRHPFATIVRDRSLCMTCDCPGTIIVTLVDDAAERILQIK